MHANASHIAAMNPATTIALLDLVAELEGALRLVRRAMDSERISDTMLVNTTTGKTYTVGDEVTDALKLVQSFRKDGKL